jgi:hypothetical protein
VRLDRLAFTISGILLGLAAVADLGLQRGDDPFALRLVPALVLRLPRPFIGGGDFPPSLSGPGIVVVYVAPAAVFLALALWWRTRKRAPDLHRTRGA